MKTQDAVDTVGKMEKCKKLYSSPKIKMIAEVRDITRGAIGSGADSGGRVPVPSDPNW